MGGFSNFLEDSLLDHVFGNTPYTQPTNIYIALTKSTLDDTHTGTTLPNEVSGGAYVRQKCNTWDGAASGATQNTQVEQYTEATANWGTVTDFALCDKTTKGNILGYGKLSTAKKIGTGDTAKFATGDIDVTLT